LRAAERAGSDKSVWIRKWCSFLLGSRLGFLFGVKLFQ